MPNEQSGLGQEQEPLTGLSQMSGDQQQQQGLFKSQQTAQQTQQMELQTIALQEQAEAAQTQAKVITFGLPIIIALLLTIVFYIAIRSRGHDPSSKT